MSFSINAKFNINNLKKKNKFDINKLRVHHRNYYVTIKFTASLEKVYDQNIPTTKS